MKYQFLLYMDGVKKLYKINKFNKNICKQNERQNILKSKEGCYLEFLTSQMMKLLESTK